jgi:hypothetical protein
VSAAESKTLAGDAQKTKHSHDCARVRRVVLCDFLHCVEIIDFIAPEKDGVSASAKTTKARGKHPAERLGFKERVTTRPAEGN